LVQDLQECSRCMLLCFPSTTAIFPSLMGFLVGKVLPLEELLLLAILPLQNQDDLVESVLALVPHRALAPLLLPMPLLFLPETLISGFSLLDPPSELVK